MKTTCKIEIKNIENDPRASWNEMYSQMLKLSKLFYNCEISMKYQSKNMNAGLVIKFINGKVIR